MLSRATGDLVMIWATALTKNSIALNRTLFIADNLSLLESLDNESIDLICIDPPFAKNQTWMGAIRPPLSKEERQQELATLADWGIRNRVDAERAGIEWPDGEDGSAKFQDIWRWVDDIHEEWEIEIGKRNEALAWTIAATRRYHGEDTAAYLTYMAIRLIEMHRVLKPTGSLYLHCDHSANSYLRMTMDAIFGRKQFRNDVIWGYEKPRPSYKQWRRNHDTILFYTKTADNVFHTQRVPKLDGTFEKRKPFKRPDGSVWQPKQPGKAAGDWWYDIPSFSTRMSAKERTGYPTQKPVALAERIVMASTNPGDIVLDCFAGCAYVPVAAERNGRRWIACDISPSSLTILRRQFAKFRYAVDGDLQGDEPAMIADANVTIRSPHDLPARTDESPEPVRAKPLPERKFKAPASIIPEREMLEFLLGLSGYMAWCCGFANRMPDGTIVETTNNFHLDHIDPTSKGGSHQITNRAPVCPRHNILKKDRWVHLREYRQEIADAGEMLVNTTDDLIDLSVAYEAALARHAQEVVKRGQQIPLER